MTNEEMEQRETILRQIVARACPTLYEWPRAAAMTPDMLKTTIDCGGGVGESLWVQAIGDQEFEIASIPLLAYDISLGDIFEGVVGKCGHLHLQRCVKKSGHRTVRVIIDGVPEKETTELFNELQALKCDLEALEGVVLSVSVPPTVDLRAVKHCFITRNLQWEMADPHV